MAEVEESMSVIKDMESLPNPRCCSPVLQESQNGTKGQAKTPLPPGNEVVVIGKGNVMMEGSQPQACVFCGGLGQLRCSVCKAWYCSMVCQVDDWYLHKNTCRSPPVLDDPQKINSSLCGTGGDAFCDAGAVMMSSSPFSSFSSFVDGLEKDISGRTSEEMDPCSGQKCCMVKEMLPARNMGNMPANLNMMTENSYNCGRGAMLKKLTEEGSYSAGRGAVPKRSNMTETASSPKPKAAPSAAVRENIGPDCGPPAATRLKETSPPQRETDVKMLAVNGSPKENDVISSGKGPPEKCNGGRCLARDVRCKLVFSEADRSHSCYVIAVNSVDLLLKLEEMSLEINQQCESSPASMFHPRRGEACLAKFVRGDGRWYRALCLALDSTCCQVIFVDYGNTEKVCHADIRPIPRQFLGLPCLALYFPQQDMGMNSVNGKEEGAGQTNSLAGFTFLATLNLSPEGKIKFLE
ncbi:uncharacterized protein LOC135089340 isoform X5 [Scylla paramamosain]|uniref:uncharacterized protein LOC135089340 isoform X5 n=1 Tax=Scylla paramamosain TaxID=85552 RepID=UPI003082CB44